MVIILTSSQWRNKFTFPTDISFLRNLNPWQNLQEIHFLRNLHKNPQVNPQEKLNILVMVGLATKKVGAEPGH
ncbi:hypothetical protein MTR_7g090010 [Medicago truncatula]|uniref:Uncharacterized protein n=1 Tax=Medicago truncatula TaxID=3880 RepID=G7KQT9_MEDTR|nr:hypothetical protein MTR_7g090010 [Medicago truncatula]